MTGTMSDLRYLLVAALLFGGLAFAPPALSSTAAKTDKQSANRVIVSEIETDAFTGALIADLEAGGFRVSQGYAALYTQQDCYDRTYPGPEELLSSQPRGPLRSAGREIMAGRVC